MGGVRNCSLRGGPKEKLKALSPGSKGRIENHVRGI